MLKLKLKYFGHLMQRTNSLEKTLESPWTASRSNQSILKEISPGYSLEGLDAEAEAPILSLAASYRVDSLEKDRKSVV